MKKQKKQKKRMGNVLFTVLWTPVLALILILAIAGTVVMSLLQTALASYTDLPGDSISIKICSRDGGLGKSVLHYVPDRRGSYGKRICPDRKGLQ